MGDERDILDLLRSIEYDEELHEILEETETLEEYLKKEKKNVKDK